MTGREVGIELAIRVWKRKSANHTQPTETTRHYDKTFSKEKAMTGCTEARLAVVGCGIIMESTRIWS